MIAMNTIRTEPHYRHAAFNAGLEAAGFKLVDSGKPRGPDDVLVMWNRQGAQESQANIWESLGGTVLVCENGYAGADAEGQQLYAISAHGHNGAGAFPHGDEDRFATLAIELKPWRTAPGYILVCGQRGIGSREMASPDGWDDKVMQRLKAMGHRNLKQRRHPGRAPSKTTLDEDLSGASLCVIWSSSSGVKALTQGVPVVYCAPHWICEGAASQGLATVSAPLRSDELRLHALRRMAFAQWTVAEIEAGEPFKRILTMSKESA